MLVRLVAFFASMLAFSPLLAEEDLQSEFKPFAGSYYDCAAGGAYEFILRFTIPAGAAGEIEDLTNQELVEFFRKEIKQERLKVLTKDGDNKVQVKNVEVFLDDFGFIRVRLFAFYNPETEYKLVWGFSGNEFQDSATTGESRFSPDFSSGAVGREARVPRRRDAEVERWA